VAARSELEALRQQRCDDPAERFIEEFALGRDLDVIELQRPTSGRTRRLEEELEALLGLREALSVERKSRQDDLRAAEFAVGQRAANVLRESDAAAKLLEGLGDLQREVSQRRGDLRFLKQRGLLPDDLIDQAEELLRFDPSGDAWHVARARWEPVIEALSRDANAEV
jgi:hypothetical protein